MEKSSKIVRFFSGLKNYFKKLGLSFIDQFRYNPAKIAMIVLLIPAVVLGFCLVFHFNAAKLFVTYDAEIIQAEILKGFRPMPDLPEGVTLADYCQDNASHLYSGFQLFALMVCGAVLLFVAVNVSGKRNLASCIQAVLVTVLIIVFGIFWIKNFFRTDEIYNVKQLTNPENPYSITDTNNIISIICVIVAMVSSACGTVLAFIFRDRTYTRDVI